MSSCTVVKRWANQHGAQATLSCGRVVVESGCWPLLVGNTYHDCCEDD
jgi:hypothetical protein